MPRLLSLLLLVGSLLLIICSALHPILPLTGAEDLAVIAGTGYWALIHQGLLYGTGLIIAGIWARWLGATPEERPLLAVAFAILALGEALNGVNIAYMAGAGHFFAAQSSASADLATIYEATHRSAVMTGRLGGFLVAVAAGIVAHATGRSVTEPRALVGIAWLGCVAGLAGNFFAPPGNPLMLTSVGLMAMWQVGTAWRGLGRGGR